MASPFDREMPFLPFWRIDAGAAFCSQQTNGILVQGKVRSSPLILV
jgi:hypothetical protein